MLALLYFSSFSCLWPPVLLKLQDFCMQKRATSNTTSDSSNYQLAFHSPQGIKHIFPLISLGYAIDQRCFKLRIGELFASYITLYQHSYLSESLLERDFHWGTFCCVLIGQRLIFSLCPPAVSTGQNGSNNFFSPWFGWPGTTAPHLCWRPELLVLKLVKKRKWMAPVLPTRKKMFSNKWILRSGVWWSFKKAKCCAIRIEWLVICYCLVSVFPSLIQH